MSGREVKLVAENLTALGYRTGHQPDKRVKVRDGKGAYTEDLQNGSRGDPRCQRRRLAD
ncbi:hypothetical protein V6W11_12470 [Micromonospora profundi]|uniref:hypothetical protein n=1 Tax=Micromonospora profundi TaxID=1420889 RepID=UPI002FF17D4D